MKDIFEFNHIDKSLSESDIQELPLEILVFPEIIQTIKLQDERITIS